MAVMPIREQTSTWRTPRRPSVDRCLRDTTHTHQPQLQRIPSHQSTPHRTMKEPRFTSRRLLCRRTLLVHLWIALAVTGGVHGQTNNYYYEDDGYPPPHNEYHRQSGDGDSYYGDDQLYHDYAARHQDMAGGAGGGLGALGIGKLFVTSAFSWYLGGRFHAGRTAKKLKAKHQAEQKQLYSQYYDDVYKLSEKNQELQLYIEQLHEALKDTEAKHELEALQRDYDEFKQPDIDGDDRISRAEFNMYVKNYLSHYPGLDESDYPKFEDFDHDQDGFVSFQEYAQQMALQAQKAEADALYKT